MDLFLSYIFLGFLQGIFEWIPVSSEGVVAIAAQYLNTGANPVDFALFLHAGTLLAALCYYWRDWIGILTFKNRELIIFLMITTVVSLPIGFIVNSLTADMAVGAGLLLLTGICLLFTAYFQSKKINLHLKQNHLALIGGIFQGFAALPGFSRSGSTIFGLSLGDLTPGQILRMSYLMSVPAVAASTAYMVIFKGEVIFLSAWPALAASFIAGLLSLDLLTRISMRINFAKFAIGFALLCFIGVALEVFA